MGSKVILDSPEILGETLISLTEACRYFPVPCSRPAVERWMRRGSRGAVLESALICGKRYTSVEAINRFVRNQLQVESDWASSPTQRSMSRKDITEASRRFGLPDPIAPTSDLAEQRRDKKSFEQRRAATDATLQRHAAGQ